MRRRRHDERVLFVKQLLTCDASLDGYEQPEAADRREGLKQQREAEDVVAEAVGVIEQTGAGLAACSLPQHARRVDHRTEEDRTRDEACGQKIGLGMKPVDKRSD